MFELRFDTLPEWTETVLANFNTFLLDHAAAEKKASGMAMSMLSHYPDRTDLVLAMTELAIEELAHFREVVKILTARGIQLAADEKDPYINQFRKTLRKGTDVYFLDRLLTAGIIEARGCERFALVAQAIADPQLKHFYTAIAESESKHNTLFFDLASLYFDRSVINERMDELLDIEANIVQTLPIRPYLH